MSSVPINVVMRRSGGGVTVLVSDTFNRANSTTLGNTDGGLGGGSGLAWTEVNAQQLDGNPQITSNKVDNGGGASVTDRLGCYVTSPQANYTASCVVRIPTSGYGGILFRVQDGSNFWMCSISPTADDVQIQDCVAGSFTTRANTSVTINTATDYTVALTQSGDVFTVTVDGGSEITHTSSTFSSEAAKVGLWGDDAGSGDQTYNDFKVVG